MRMRDKPAPGPQCGPGDPETSGINTTPPGLGGRALNSALAGFARESFATKRKVKILVTGAGGYIAEALIPQLQGAGHYVIPLCRWHREPHVRRYSMLRYHPGNTEQVWFADLSKGFGKLVAEKPPDTVIHLAGRVDINLLPNPKGTHLPPVPGPCDIGALYRDNVLATANVLQYCLQAGVKHLIFASTQAVYGCGYEPNPLEHYAASKLAAEQLLVLGRAQGIDVTIMRLPGIYGGDRRVGLIYAMCRSALEEGIVRCEVPYPLQMNVLHIEDAVNALRFVVGVNASIRNCITDPAHECEACSPTILAQEIASLIPGCRVESNGIEHVMERWVPSVEGMLWGWKSKPRKERLAQVLEEIRRENG